MLQNLANKPSYAKEPYMVKLQPFIQRNKERINKFLLDLCEVQDFYESLEMDNYVALSKRDLDLSITLNEVYAMHTLLEKHTHELTRGDNGHLGVLLHELGPAPAQIPRKDNRTITLPLFSKWETQIDDLTAALDITQEEIYFMEAKSTFVMMLRSLPGNTSVTRRPLRLERIAEAAATTKNDTVMVKKGIRSLELLNQLQEMGVINKEDGFALLRDEIEQELVHLGSMREKVIEESRKLEEVYRTIRDHNIYLQQQLETYKSYLHNVRSQAEGKQRKQQKHQVLGPYKFTHAQLEREGVIQKSNVPENRRANIFFNFTSPLPGTFVISLHYKGMPWLLEWLSDKRRSKSGSLGARPEAGRPARDAKGQPGGPGPGIRPVQRHQGPQSAEQAVCAQEGLVSTNATSVYISRPQQATIDLVVLTRSAGPDRTLRRRS
jgi:Ras GTPase-activating-like protein IQGAP2/3